MASNTERRSEESVLKPGEDGLPLRTNTAYGNKLARPRWILHLQAQFWRFLMSIGMYLHRLAPPHPPRPSFVRTIPAKLSGKPGQIGLYFYTPKGYEIQKKLWKGKPRPSFDEDEEQLKTHNRRRSVISQVGDTIKRKSSISRKWGGYPVVLNCHGGGFTLGSPVDDARWCGTVVDECQAVVVALDYRLAPEHPFPTAVEDGVDALVWIHEHAEELGIDQSKIALSGFSSGGNMAFTIALRLRDELTGFAREEEDSAVATSSNQLFAPGPMLASAASSSSHLPQGDGRVEVVDPAATAKKASSKSGTRVSTKRLDMIPDIKIRAIVSWYPSLDYTRTREQRRATNIRKDQELSALFTDLFDESYLHPSRSIALDSPYLSPGVAPTSLLRDGLPQDIILFTCEWDMLYDEGQAFHQRLISPPLNKSVVYKKIEGVPHGWDKAPNPWKPTPGVKEHYLRACKELRRAFTSGNFVDRRASEGPSAAAPRSSIQFLR